MSETNLLKGKINLESGSDPQAAETLSSSQKLLSAANELIGTGEKGVKFRQAVCEFTGSLTAGITGAVVFSVGTAASRGIGRAGSLALAMTLSGAVKFSVKSGLEHLLLEEDKRTASKEDFAWGAVDGLAGVAGSLAERQISTNFMRSLGRKHLGADISATMAEMAGAKVISGSIAEQIKHNSLRGITGGAAGGFVWSVPHSLAGNWERIAEDPLSGLNATKNQILSDTVTGMFLGGTISGLGTAIIRSPQIARHGLARIEGDAQVARLDIAHLNDLHSELTGAHGLPRIATKLDELRAKSAESGRPHHFYVAGDTESGNVIYSFTRGGYVENEALARMKMDALIPGNHPYDVAGGGYDVGKYVKVMARVSEGRQLPLLAANLDLSAYPEYQAMVRPYAVREIATAEGPQKVGIIGLITEEGAVGKIKFRDPVEVAERSIAELHARGINKVIVLSHLGLTGDVDLARRVKGISAIIGGHSHDFEPIPRWVRQGSTDGRAGMLSLLLRRNADPHAGWEVPIVQAGSNGRWLGELNLAFRANGAADRYRTSGRLHPITKEIPANREIDKFINNYLDDLKDLKGLEYNSEAVAPYSMTNIRNRETPLGNLISDAMLSQVRRHLGEDSVDIVLMNSGAIRSGLKAHDPITRLDLANVFMNAGRANLEVKELHLVKMTGRQVRDALEYGVHDMSAADGFVNQNVLKRIRLLLSDPAPPSYRAEPGSFLQVAGLKYSFDLSKTPRMPGESAGGRVSEVLVRGKGGAFQAIDDNKVYTVAARLHAIAKWHMHGIFGDQRNFRDTLKKVAAENPRLSQVDLLGEHIQGRTLDPAKIGRVDGRIRDLTPQPWEPTLRPGISLPAYAAMSSRTPYWAAESER